MIDALYDVYSKYKEDPLDPNYKPSDAIIGRKFINPHSRKLVVIFPGWHTHNFPVNVLAKRLAKRGWAVLFYDFHDQIMEPDQEVVVESFRYIRDTVCSEIQKLMAEQNYEQIHFIGISLGGVPLALVSDKFHHFTSVTSVVGGDNLAIDMWYGMRTEPYRRAFEKMHIGVRHLAQEWENVAPDNHLKHFKGKPVKLVISLHDKFVRTEYQKKLARQLEEVGAKVTTKKRLVGHTLTIVRFCLFDAPL